MNAIEGVSKWNPNLPQQPQILPFNTHPGPVSLLCQRKARKLVLRAWLRSDARQTAGAPSSRHCLESCPLSNSWGSREPAAPEYEAGGSGNRAGGCALPGCPAARHLQGSSVSGWAAAFPRDMIAGRSVLALASLVTVVTVGALLAALLTAPAPEARSAVASPRDGVAQGPVFALAPAAAVRPPVITVAGWGWGKKEWQTSKCGCGQWQALQYQPPSPLGESGWMTPLSPFLHWAAGPGYRPTAICHWCSAVDHVLSLHDSSIAVLFNSRPVLSLLLRLECCVWCGQSRWPGAGVSSCEQRRGRLDRREWTAYAGVLDTSRSLDCI